MKTHFIVACKLIFEKKSNGLCKRIHSSRAPAVLNHPIHVRTQVRRHLYANAALRCVHRLYSVYHTMCACTAKSPPHAICYINKPVMLFIVGPYRALVRECTKTMSFTSFRKNPPHHDCNTHTHTHVGAESREWSLSQKIKYGANSIVSALLLLSKNQLQSHAA